MQKCILSGANVRSPCALCALCARLHGAAVCDRVETHRSHM